MATSSLKPSVTAASTSPRLSLQSEVIAADSSTIRSLDWERSRFDIEFGLRNGTTYNAFLVRGERTALIDTSHAKFRDTWLPLLKEQIDPKQIDYLIVSHTEPDHSGLIGDLIDLNPEIEIVGSKVAIQFLNDQVHRPFRSRAVKSGEELDLGINPESGVQHRFEFLSAPNLHWPDTIFSFDHGSGILYTCDAFGLHYCSEDVFDSDPGAIAPDFRFYYDCLMGPNARSVLQALKRMDGLPEINTIAVGHGPLLRHHLSHWINDYREWSGQRNKGESYAAVCYLSQYGFCDRLSQAIAHGINRDAIIESKFRGKAVLSTGMLAPTHWAYNGNVERFDFDQAKAKALLDEAGYPDPDGDGPLPRFELEFKVSANKFRVSMVELIAHQLAEIGIAVRVRASEWGTFYGDIKSRNFALTTMQWPSVLEPSLYRWVFHSENIPTPENRSAGANRGAYRNGRIDALLVAGNLETDREKRRKIYDEVQAILAAELPYISLWHEDNVAVVKRGTKGYFVTPNARFESLKSTIPAGNP